MISDPTSEFTTQRTRELAILNAIAQALNRTVDLNAALQTTLAHVADLLGLQTGWIWLLNEQTGASYLAAAQNLPPALSDTPQSMEGSCYCLDTYQAGDLAGAANVNVLTCTRLHKLVEGTDGLRYHASIPLYAHGKHLGVLNVASPDWRKLSAHDLQLLYTVGDMLSIAIERARLFATSTQLGALEERNRLAREIHDTLAQGLTAIALQLEAADALLDLQVDSQVDLQASVGKQPASSQSVQLKSFVQQALQLTRTNLAEARQSVLDLRAAPLQGRSLTAALEALASEQNRQGLTVTFATVGGGRPLPVAVEAGLYRIAQETFNNIRTHAVATSVQLELITTPDAVTLVIEDDGQGFDQSCINENRFGVVGMNERANLLGGNLQIESEQGAGTRVTVQIPIRK